jgi:hypothetical protein
MMMREAHRPTDTTSVTATLNILGERFPLTWYTRATTWMIMKTWRSKISTKTMNQERNTDTTALLLMYRDLSGNLK